ncbi:tyrosine-type recombinase/integrase [Streptomyces sp. PTM05]|uniref:Tyrosine-type recombinase/integrase n=1 Tax=Streptantibioticus parmotrematis TaxID=2873249 RepID=A0ABS7QQ12_9ACTN|nr:tyrosine-type recombinase/integrase [Streptantibioticus parmotrematis]MBY8884749.1 tyrosine-type recombinase/integrase [Streptantibioticus parmotrematis]
MFEDKTYKRCACKGPLVDKKGDPVLNQDGTPKIGYLEKRCPLLKRRDHGSWYYSIELPPGPGGKRQHPKKGGFRTQKDAAAACKEVWDLAQGGVQVKSKETVAEYLRRWFTKRVDLKRSTRKGYQDHIERVFIPALGHLKMRDLRTRHIQGMFEAIWADNKTHQDHREAAEAARAAERAAHKAWRDCKGRPRPPELRQNWNAARAELRQARAKPRHITGPGTQKKMNDTLSAALEDAVTEKLISENWAKSVVLPKYVRPKPLVWTDERVARWQVTGEKPGPVMVWTPEQTGAFLDAVAEHRLYPMFHLMVFRGLRRGEVAGLPWSETNLTIGTVHVSEQLVAASYEVWEDTPKSESGARTITLDEQTHDLLRLWRKRQQTEREEWDRAYEEWRQRQREHPQPETDNTAVTQPWSDTGLVFTWEDGRAYHPEYLSQVFERLIKKLHLPPVRLHDLRHCAATLSLAAGIHMKKIQALLGHSSYSLTADTYTSVLPQFEKAEAEAPVALVPRARNQRESHEEPEPPDGESVEPEVPSNEPGETAA